MHIYIYISLVPCPSLESHCPKMSLKTKAKIPKSLKKAFGKMHGAPAAILRINHEQCLDDMDNTLYTHQYGMIANDKL